MQTAARPDPLAFFDSITDRYGSVPPPRDLEPLDYWLRENGYTEVARKAIVGHAARWGSLQCCEWVEPEDREHGEDLLPDLSASAWDITGGRRAAWFVTPTEDAP
jgi:hypothetical protein